MVGSGEGAEQAVVHSIACNFFCAGNPRRILLGVRQPSTVSDRHPGVLSTPTLRIPRALFEALGAPPWSTARGDRVRLLEDQPVLRTGPKSFGEPAAFAVEHLMSRKLGLAEALARGTMRAAMRAVTLAVDDVDDPLATGAIERTFMVGFDVIIEEGAELIPERTSSYSRLLWADTELLAEALKRKDALIVDDSLNPFEVCIGGLCVQSAVHHLERFPHERRR